MRRVFLTLAALVLLLAGYLLVWPVPVAPEPWVAPAAPGYVGPHAVNQKLAGLNAIDLSGDEGPEHIVVRDGWVYAALASGSIVRMKPDGSGKELVVRTGGRPLGFDFDANGALLIADPMFGDHGGLLRATGMGESAKVEVLTDNVHGDPIRYADGVVAAKNGKVYFTDASRRFGAKAWGGTFAASVLDVVEHSSTGRLLEYDPVTQATRILLSDLCFANGLALSADEQSIFVNETGEYRIWKLPVATKDASAKKPPAEVTLLLQNLPGHPDNLMRGLDGRLWVGLVKPRGAFIDNNAGKPWMRKLALRLPKALWPVPPAYGHVFAFDESGKVLVDLQDPSGAYPETTAITETPDRLYVQSLHAKTLGWLEKSKAGL
ncbi:SMP-30/gluconolactonase/LRE family protein [Piscinibacter terrae]|uniref:SMP-30/gluconolactonase/LRE family protein n=1 Tax=Piscinibacter terrae TaxID=2496871 RepID=A0A3N7HQ50_9BURK|nr:SMP-30/gluconolactonase/LRE family protein [Albitalea terrae]RQP24304.1 SMP-30/gluconolactonase/LRE family protein [Albitalea terrae]